MGKPEGKISMSEAGNGQGASPPPPGSRGCEVCLEQLRICVSRAGCGTQSPTEAQQELSCHTACSVVMGCRQQHGSSFQLELKQSGRKSTVGISVSWSHRGFWSGTKSVVTALLLGGSTSS